MARVYTFTKTSTMEPENIEELSSSLTPPTREEVTAQLEEHFSENDKDMVTPEDIEILTNVICQEFDELKDQPYRGFARYNPTKPCLTIRRYSNEWYQYEGETRPRDYSMLKEIIVVCSKINFTVTVVSYSKWVSLSYISKECVF